MNVKWASAVLVVTLAVAARADPIYFGAAARGGLDPALATSMRAALERSLSAKGVKVLDTSNAAEDTAQQALVDAKSALDEAAAAFKDEEWPQALAATGHALESFERGPAFTDDDDAWALYRDVLSLRALVYLKLKKKKDADAALHALLVALPKYAPNPDKAPPDLVRHVDDVRDELRSLPPARLEIASKPSGARVIIDGRRRGKSPLDLDDLVPGVHYVALEGTAGRYNERLILGETGKRISARLGSRKGAAAHDVVLALEKPMTAKAFVAAVGDVDDDAVVAVLLPAGKKVEIVAARVAGGEVKVVCGVRVGDTENDRARASFVLAEGMLTKSADAWLDEAAGDDPAGLRQRLFSGTGTLAPQPADEPPGPGISPALIAVGVVGGIIVVAAVGTGAALFIGGELKKNDAFTFSVDTSGL